jgi:hypothetical protein
MLELLKYAGVVLAAAFGVLGILTDFKDKATNKVTIWGKIAVFGAILSGILAIASQHFEVQQNNKSSEEAAARAAALLAQQSQVSERVDAIARTTEPIREVELEFWIDFPRPLPRDDGNLVKAMGPYLSRLDKIVNQIVKQYPRPVTAASSYALIALPNADKPIKVTIPSGSPLLPSSNETVPFLLLSKVFFYVDVYNQPIPPDTFWSALDWHNEPLITTAGRVFLAKSADLEIGDAFSLFAASHCELVYDVESHRIMVHCKRKVAQEAWNSNGTIRYLQDLLGKQVFLRWQLGSFDFSEGKLKEDLVSRPFALLLTSDVRLDTAVISVNRQPYEFHGDDFRNESTASNYLYLSLPTTKAGLDKLISPGWDETAQ